MVHKGGCKTGRKQKTRVHMKGGCLVGKKRVSVTKRLVDKRGKRDVRRRMVTVVRRKMKKNGTPDRRYK